MLSFKLWVLYQPAPPGPYDEQEIYELEELVDKFSTDRITKSAAVFDNVKLNWMNGQHFRALPSDEQATRVGAALAGAGVVAGLLGGGDGLEVCMVFNGILVFQRNL